jgi:hypothetical protein
MTMIDDIPNSRRKVMKDLATGLMLASAAPAAFGQNSGRKPASAELLPNPITEYPRPPSPRNSRNGPVSYPK